MSYSVARSTIRLREPGRGSGLAFRRPETGRDSGRRVKEISSAQRKFRWILLSGGGVGGYMYMYCTEVHLQCSLTRKQCVRINLGRNWHIGSVSTCQELHMSYRGMR